MQKARLKQLLVCVAGSLENNSPRSRCRQPESVKFIDTFGLVGSAQQANSNEVDQAKPREWEWRMWCALQTALFRLLRGRVPGDAA